MAIGIDNAVSIPIGMDTAPLAADAQRAVQILAGVGKAADVAGKQGADGLNRLGDAGRKSAEGIGVAGNAVDELTRKVG